MVKAQSVNIDLHCLLNALDNKLDLPLLILARVRKKSQGGGGGRGQPLKFLKGCVSSRFISWGQSKSLDC